MDIDLNIYDVALVRRALLNLSMEDDVTDEECDFLNTLAEMLEDCGEAGTTLHLNCS